MRPLWRGLLLSLMVWPSATAVGAEMPPRRVASINLCTDQLAMLLAAPDQLVSVSYLSADPAISAMVAQAEGMHLNHGQAEEIALLAPDLVLAGRYTSQATVGMLQRLGMPVVIFDPENGFDDIRLNMRRMGVALGQQAKAEALITGMEAELADLAERAQSDLIAAPYYSGGYTAGGQSLAQDILTAAGLRNLSEVLGMRGGILSLEDLAFGRPDMVILGQSYTGHSRAQEMLSHPVLSRIIAATGISATTRPEWTCGTTLVTQAVAALLAAIAQGEKAPAP